MELDRDKVKLSLEDAMFNNRFKIIRNDEDREIGFFTWEERIAEGKLEIAINNMLILREHRGKFNLLKIRNWFKELYPRLNYFYWKSRRRNKIFRADAQRGGCYVQVVG